MSKKSNFFERAHAAHKQRLAEDAREYQQQMNNKKSSGLFQRAQNEEGSVGAGDLDVRRSRVSEK